MPIDLAPFCATDDIGRYVLGHPFVQRGYLYATDGRIFVRVPSEEPDAVTTDGRTFPNCDGIVGAEDWADCTEAWPEYDGMVQTERRDCDCVVECSSRDGSGACTCSTCDDDHTCGVCDGIGAEATPGCTVCDGIGWFCTDIPARQHVAHRSIQHKYFARIAALPNARYRQYSDGDYICNGVCKVLAFIADGGLQGLVGAVRERE